MRSIQCPEADSQQVHEQQSDHGVEISQAQNASRRGCGASAVSGVILIGRGNLQVGPGRPEHREDDPQHERSRRQGVMFNTPPLPPWNQRPGHHVIAGDGRSHAVP